MSKSESVQGISAADPFDGTSYRLVRHLARGGMGQVYLVEHRELGRECVAKVIHKKLAKNSQLLDRVRIEAESPGALRHPNIVSVNNFGTVSDGRPFIVMEYLRGRDLGRALGSGLEFSIRESIELILQACAALSAAHSIGIVHRDIKPYRRSQATVVFCKCSNPPPGWTTCCSRRYVNHPTIDAKVPENSVKQSLSPSNTYPWG